QTQPIEQTPIMLTQPGELDELKVKNGDNVKKDDDLAVIKSEAGEQTIKAPKKGVVANMPDSTGNMVSNEEPFAMIIDLDDIKIKFKQKRCKKCVIYLKQIKKSQSK